MQRAAAGFARRRSKPTSPPQSAQMPYLPSAIFTRKEHAYLNRARGSKREASRSSWYSFSSSSVSVAGTAMVSTA